METKIEKVAVTDDVERLAIVEELEEIAAPGIWSNHNETLIMDTES